MDAKVQNPESRIHSPESRIGIQQIVLPKFMFSCTALIFGTKGVKVDLWPPNCTQNQKSRTQYACTVQLACHIPKITIQKVSPHVLIRCSQELGMSILKPKDGLPNSKRPLSLIPSQGIALANCKVVKATTDKSKKRGPYKKRVINLDSS